MATLMKAASVKQQTIDGNSIRRRM